MRAKTVVKPIAAVRNHLKGGDLLTARAVNINPKQRKQTMQIKDQLAKTYKDKSLKAVEDDARENQDKSMQHRRDFILALYYLQFTGRFRENLAYKKETFESYINDIFHLRIGTYNEERWAFIKYEDAAKTHGPGLVTEIKRKCGHGNVRKVIAEIDTAEKKSTAPLSKSKKEKIIFKNALPEKEKPRSEPKKVIEQKLDIAVENYRMANSTIKTKDEQISKLKSAVTKLKAENVELRAVIESYQAKDMMFKPFWSELTDVIERMPAVV